MKKSCPPVRISAIASAIAETTDIELSNLFLQGHDIEKDSKRRQGDAPIVGCFVASIGEAIAIDSASERVKDEFGVVLAIYIKDRSNCWVGYPHVDCNYPRESGISPKPLSGASLS